MSANEPSSCPGGGIPRLPGLDKEIIDTTSKKSTQIIDLPNISDPTYIQYCQLVEEFHSGNENSELYNQLIRPHFKFSLGGDIQKAHENYFNLLKEFLNDTDTGKSVSKDLKDILLHLGNISSLRESIGKKSPQERYDILNEYLKILPYIYNSAKVNILRNVVVFLLGKSSFSISGKALLYGKKFLEEL